VILIPRGQYNTQTDADRGRLSTGRKPVDGELHAMIQVALRETTFLSRKRGLQKDATRVHKTEKYAVFRRIR